MLAALVVALWVLNQRRGLDMQHTELEAVDEQGSNSEADKASVSEPMDVDDGYYDFPGDFINNEFKVVRHRM